MRQIKFRAWDKKHERWVYVELPDNANALLTLTTPVGNLEPWQQYTGLLDKNGKEIYEGDILDDLGVIEFRDDLNWDSGGSIHSGYFSTKGYEYKDDGCLSYHYQISEREVIGNIYENPELLK